MLNNESKFFKKLQIELLFTCNFCHCWSWDDGVSTWIQICAPNIWLLLLLVWPVQVWTCYPTNWMWIWIFIQIPIRSLAHSFCGQLWIWLPYKIGEMKPWIRKIFSFGFIEFSMTKLFNIWQLHCMSKNYETSLMHTYWLMSFQWHWMHGVRSRIKGRSWQLNKVNLYF
jgi:hypothetical protein